MSLTKEDLIAISDLVGVKLEEQEKRINKRFDLVDKKFEDVYKRFDEVDKKFDVINKKFEEVDRRFDLVDKKFEEVDKRFDLVDKKFEEVDKRFDKQEHNFDKKLDNLKAEFIEILADNNTLIAEHVQRAVSESEERLSQQIKEIKTVTADNCFNIVSLKNKIS
ncbi:MAG: hypothetical protein WBJ13_03905 [Sedimentibacter sp.]